MIEMSIESVRVSMQNLNRVVILREKDSERYLVIWIGPAEAEAIAMRLGDVAPPRPQTHDLLRNLIESLGGVVTHVLVNDIQNDTYYARIIVDVDGRSVDIDSRPSDAIALAVRAEVPVYVDESVLDRAGILLEKDSDEGAVAAPGQNEPVSRTNPEEIERMSAFRDFIESLDLDDFEKRRPE